MSDARHFRLVSHWRLSAPRERVWQALKTPTQWPHWWPYVAAVDTLAEGDADGVGACHALHWTSRLPYAIRLVTRVTEVVPPSRIVAQASGDLEGTGVWTLSDAGDGTAVEYEWSVAVDRAWMRLLAPLLRPVFAWNHNAVMEGGEAGLRRHLA